MAKNPAKQNPYDGRRIFEPVRALDALIADLPTYKGIEARVMAGPDVYRRIYAEAEAFLQNAPMLSVDDAAQKQGVTKGEYIRMVDRGEALLIELEGKQYVPACSFGADGKIDPLKIDIAREFALEGQQYFKFIDYLTFMNTQKVDIADLTLSTQQMSALFNQAGLAGYRCSITVEATMNQLADHRHKLPAAFERLTENLDRALTNGGWDPSGGLSRPFRDKYGIAGETIDEMRGVAPPPAAKGKKNTPKPK
ncbi:MAG: hypothetical protein Q8K13_04180 [Parvibaculum sp.]|uniref:hypothetical protein n=1 Tax=Parvibaculum sp. TaxID=2024848 RepID=UPI0027312E87|nr:hypothetical protein [Parvibaculum sp.]MDP2148824.1 hypothetical protein [Parvibaculum sp.]